MDEIGNNYIQKNLKTAQELQSAGIEMEKSWSAVDDGKDCEICKRNEDAGWIPLNQPFPSGHQTPLGHDECRCDLRTRRTKETINKNQVKPTSKPTPRPWSRKVINIALITTAISCVACVVFGIILQAVSPATPTSAPIINIAPTNTETIDIYPTTRCAPASQQQIDIIRLGIKDIDTNNDIQIAWAVKSNDFENVWFVSAEIFGPGIQPKQAIGTWAISGDLATPGIILSVDGFAKTFSIYPDGSTTDAQTSMTNDGAQEALACATNY